MSPQAHQSEHTIEFLRRKGTVVVVLVGRQLIVDLVSAPPSDSTYHFYWLEPPVSAANVAYLVKILNYPANFTHFAEVL